MLNMLQSKIGRRVILCSIVFVLCSLSWGILHRLYRVSRIPVAGSITVDGKPVRSGVVSFTPNVGKGNTTSVSATANIIEGRYEVAGFGTIGLPRGWYRVSVEGFLLPSRSNTPTRKDGFAKGGVSADSEGIWTPGLSGDPASYFSTYNRPFSILVTDEGEAVSFDFDLSSDQTEAKPKRQSK
jgi:hypothetical protein